MNKFGLGGLGGAPKTPAMGGLRLLNINVGASTIETAEKFRQIDQELQLKNFGDKRADHRDSDKGMSGVSDNDVPRDIKKEQEQDIP